MSTKCKKDLLISIVYEDFTCNHIKNIKTLKFTQEENTVHLTLFV